MRGGAGRNRILFFFLDGVGLAPAGPDNPLSTVPMPNMGRLLGGAMVSAWDAETHHRDTERTEILYRGVDACLGVPGLPQSATGQTALFTGVNAPALVGDHVTAYPTARLREVLAEHSVLKQAAERGAEVTLANAYSDWYWARVREDGRRLSASTLAMMACGRPFRTLDDLAAGQAVMWDLTNEVAAGYLGLGLAAVAAEEAGARLARLAAGHDLVLFESFLTDAAGHGRIEPAWVLTRLDAFLGGLLAERSPDTTLVICSDHGNIEDTTTRAHTTNPVPLLVYGPAAGYFRQATAVTDVAPAILASLELREGDGSRSAA